MGKSGRVAPANADEPNAPSIRRGNPNTMRKVVLALVILLVLVLAGGAAFLTVWEVPPPTTQMQIDIPNERFTR